MLEPVRVVVRRIDIHDLWYLCHAGSYQNAFRSGVNGFKKRADAVKFAEQNGCTVEKHEHDTLQAED